jgi:hypothetical protein
MSRRNSKDVRKAGIGLVSEQATSMRPALQEPASIKANVQRVESDSTVEQAVQQLPVAKRVKKHFTTS